MRFLWHFHGVGVFPQRPMKLHPQQPRGSQSSWEERRHKSFQAWAEEPLGTDSHRTISKWSSKCWLLIHIVNNRICWNFAITEAIMAGTNSLKWFLKKTPGTEKHKDKIKNVMALLRCHCNADCNKTQIIRNCHLYVIQNLFSISLLMAS